MEPDSNLGSNQGVDRSVDPGSLPAPEEGLARTGGALSAAERWHELLTTRYVCEACLTRYFMKYRKCKACGQVGRIRLLTAALFELADSDGELREMIANGQRMMFEAERAAGGGGEDLMPGGGAGI